jgi:hypothetical protein
MASVDSFDSAEILVQILDVEGDIIRCRYHVARQHP